MSMKDINFVSHFIPYNEEIPVKWNKYEAKLMKEKESYRFWLTLSKSCCKIFLNNFKAIID